MLESAACLRLSATLAPAQRVSMRTLRPMVQPNSETYIWIGGGLLNSVGGHIMLHYAER